MQKAIERRSPTGVRPAGLQDATIERVLSVAINNARIKLFGTFDSDTKNAVIILAGELRQ
jgi:hypothetical protein